MGRKGCSLTGGAGVLAGSRRGLGADMLREAHVAALSQRCVQLELACNTLRLDAHRFYEREGFKRYHYKFTKPLTGEDNPNALGR